MFLLSLSSLRCDGECAQASDLVMMQFTHCKPRDMDAHISRINVAVLNIDLGDLRASDERLDKSPCLVLHSQVYMLLWVTCA